MKNTYFKISAVFFLTVPLLVFAMAKNGTITGKIMPSAALKDVWAVSARDTVRALIMEGSFTIVNLKPGTYKVIINAIEPYKDVVREGIAITGGLPVDMGEIRLEK